MVIGAQVFTVRDYIRTEKDIVRTFKKIADIGYKTVQISAIGEIEPKKLRKICDDVDLKIVLTHTNPDRILNDIDGVIEEHNILGCEHIGIGSMPNKYRTEEWYKYFAEDYKKSAEEFKKAGKLFMYHNHAFEFRKINDQLIMDYLIDSFSKDEMGFTLDTFWVQSGGADLIDWIEKLEGRLPCVHLKDMTVTREEKVIMAPVMEGNINFPKILKSLEKAGTKYALVEQDICVGSPFEALETSYKNLEKLGYK